MDMASYRRDMVYLRKSERRRGEPRKWRPHPDNPHWAYLSDELERDLVAAVRHGEPVAPILREYGIVPMSYYRWQWIAQGRMRRWSDGRPIQLDVRSRCWELCIALASARCEYAAARLEQLLGLQHVRA
jgi:hypothetical protein